MGSSKKQTVSYWYHPTFQMVLHEGPFDKLLEIRGGDVTAWKGEMTASGSIQIDAANIWGGEEKEGGIQGAVDVSFGEMDAQPNAYFQTAIGADPSGHNGYALLQFNGGRYGAGNPYPKPISVLTERLYQGWLDDACWYPEKVAVPINEAPPFNVYWRKTTAAPYLFTSPGDDAGWSANPADHDVEDTEAAIEWGSGVRGAAALAWLHIEAPAGVPASFHIDVKTNYDDSGKVLAAHNVTVAGATPPNPVPFYPREEGVRVAVPASAGPFSGWVAYAVVDGRDIDTGENIGSPIQHRMLNSALGTIPSDYAMNPAHVIYDSLIYLQGEPIGSIDEASFMAAADTLYAEGFGICTRYDHDRETIEQFRQRILDLIGAECSRYNGRWYLDLIRPLTPEQIDALPVLGDDDILDWEEDVATIDDMVNQVSVKWFDPVTKQERVTAPVQALAAINAMGVVSADVKQYLEVPYERLAQRLADRDLRNKSTPTRRLRLTTNRRPYSWRKGGAFRLETPKRGISAMVCRVADIDRGTLHSGAIRLVAVQDVFAMPETTYVVGQPPIPPPSQVPVAIEDQKLFEAPYVELAGLLSPTELEALDEEAGYVMAVGARPGIGQGYALLTRPAGGDFERAGIFDWCPSALVVEGAGYTDTEFTLASGSLLARVEPGTAALWGSEIVRVDALDPVTGAVTLGRGCADTVAVKHAPGERIHFFDTWAASDRIEYVATETVEAKLLPRTGTQELAPGDAPTLDVTLDQRAARPYPPAKLRVGGLSDPSVLIGDVAVTWAHRDRVAQADRLVDAEVASVGPEPGTTYTLRAYLNDVLDDEQTGITGTTATWSPSSGGLARVELFSVRDGLESWQAAIREFEYGALNLTGTLPSAYLGVAYSASLTASGGVPPYTWSLVGSAPPGLTIDPGTGEISGTPSSVGSYTFDVQVEDTEGVIVMSSQTVEVSSGWELNNMAFDSIVGSLAGAGSDGGNSTNQLQGLWFKPDGMRVYITRGNGSAQGIYQLDMSAPWDLSTLAYTPGQMVPAPELGSGNSLTFSPDGMKMWHLSGDNYLYYWTLSTAWDITTATYTGTRLNLGSSNAQCLQFSGDGSSFLVTVFSANAVRRYSMSVAWDISTATLADSITFSSPTGLAVKEDGTLLWVARYQAGSGPHANRVVVEYSLPTPWSLAGATATGKTFSYGGAVGQCQALVVRPGGNKAYMAENLSKATEGIYQFTSG